MSGDVEQAYLAIGNWLELLATKCYPKGLLYFFIQMLHSYIVAAQYGNWWAK